MVAVLAGNARQGCKSRECHPQMLTACCISQCCVSSNRCVLVWLQLRHQVDDLVMPQDESLRTEATAIAQVGPATH